jgi:hypothetical protein
MPKPVRRQPQVAPRRRAPVLTQERVDGIVDIIRDWKERLTWEALCSEIARRTKARYTRQALHKHVPIRAAYEAYREKPAPAEGKQKLTEAQQRIQALQRRVQELEAVRDTLLAKYARWAYNAHTRNLTEEFLDQPLPMAARSGRRDRETK